MADRPIGLLSGSAVLTHVVVIGAGVAGITTAYSLLRRGFCVTVMERHRYAAMETSFANGGQLSASNAEVWNSVSTIMKGLRWVLKKDAPLLLNPMPSWHKYSWIAEFASNIKNYEQNTIATAKLAIDARKRLLAIAEREGIKFDLEQRGILHVYRDKPSFDHALGVNRLLNIAGLDRRPVTPEEVRAIEPTMRGKYYGGFFTPSDCTGDINKFTQALAAVCERQGARMEFDCEVESILSNAQGVEVKWSRAGVTTATQARAVIVCAGCGSRQIASTAGDRINVYPVKGYSITVALRDTDSQAAAPWVSLLDDDAKIVTSRLGLDRFRVAGTAEFNGFNKDIRADRIKPLVNWVRHHFPMVSTDVVVPWAGLRPMMPDMMPRVERGRQPGVYYNTGHGHLGWTLSAATADLVAEQFEQDQSGIPRQLAVAS